MIITSIKIRILKDSPSKMKGIASIVLDNLFVINEIKVLCSNDNFFLAMPSRETKVGGHKDLVHPINETGRKIVEKAVLYVYELAVSHNNSMLEVEYKGSRYDPLFQFDPEEYEMTHSRNSNDDYAIIHHGSTGNDHLSIKPKDDTVPDDELTKWLES